MNSESVSMSTYISTYLSYFILIIYGHIRDRIGKVFCPKKYKKFYRENDMAPLYTDLESFFVRRLYTRIKDCWNRPITGVPGRIITVLERFSEDENETFKFTGNKMDLLNFASYNYLGFSTNEGEITRDVLETVEKYPVNFAGPTNDIGTNEICKELEKEMADFLHKEDCIVFPMGFGTNSCNIPVLMRSGSLVFSDELNHTSIIYGTRMSDAMVKTFAHNNMKDLERQLRYHISQGQPVTHRSWKRIFVIVEGLYSMEGTLLRLKELVELKRKYKFYIFIDEAHSIGAIGKTGRGICEYADVDFNEIDLLMGTFTKSFGGFGGYIAASKKIIDYLRIYSDFSLYGEQLSPIVAAQILSALKCLKYTEHGRNVRRRLEENTIYFREKLANMGFVLFGDTDSPVVPLMIYNPGKLGEFSRLCMERKLAVVVVGYPATPVISSRVRFCLSGSHTHEDIESALSIIEYVGKKLGMNILKKKGWF
ncbi:serine palmitoyltransferase [Hamiltosporidium tvaerminnensis]|uniref:serine C-palmitoyltransferase n=2 Tax=Hamiltosporidium TaxID=1176354 RepID=A0A4Q9M208_9MICR|nr:serine palmitoyltransferase [Hamiltosporidium tvaerminnensis]TBU18335.1 serine palmitoyltransferase [Hamiltosporidium tvaerminnensis]